MKHSKKSKLRNVIEKQYRDQKILAFEL